MFKAAPEYISSTGLARAAFKILFLKYIYYIIIYKYKLYKYIKIIYIVYIICFFYLFYIFNSQAYYQCLQIADEQQIFNKGKKCHDPFVLQSLSEFHSTYHSPLFP